MKNGGVGLADAAGRMAMSLRTIAAAAAISLVATGAQADCAFDNPVPVKLMSIRPSASDVPSNLLPYEPVSIVPISIDVSAPVTL